jgi:hypothetical protein
MLAVLYFRLQTVNTVHTTLLVHLVHLFVFWTDKLTNCCTRTDAGITGSNLTRSMDIYVRFELVFRTIDSHLGCASVKRVIRYVRPHFKGGSPVLPPERAGKVTSGIQKYRYKYPKSRYVTEPLKETKFRRNKKRSRKNE